MGTTRVEEHVPELAQTAREALPPRRSPELRTLAGAAAGTVALAVGVAAWALLERWSALDDGAAYRLAFLPAWLLALPWLKRLDLRPVPWFFGCTALGPFAGPALAATAAYRAASLPYRDWEVGYWHGYRARRVPGLKAVVVLGADQVPVPRLPRWLVLTDTAQRAAWCVVLPAVLLALVLEDHLAFRVGQTIFGAVVLLLLSHIAVAAVLSRRPAHPAVLDITGR